MISRSTPAVVYLIWVACPLIAQRLVLACTRQHLITESLVVHAWYNEKFKEDYAMLHRKAIIPWVV